MIWPQPDDGPCRIPSPPESAPWIAAVLSEIAGRFSCKDTAQLCRARLGKECVFNQKLRAAGGEPTARTYGGNYLGYTEYSIAKRQ